MALRTILFGLVFVELPSALIHDAARDLPRAVTSIAAQALSACERNRRSSS